MEKSGVFVKKMYLWLLKGADVLVADEVPTVARRGTRSSRKGLSVNSCPENSEAFKQMAPQAWNHRDFLVGIGRVGERVTVKVKGRACRHRVSLVGQ